MSDAHFELAERLHAVGQQHLLSGIQDLDDCQQERFLAAIATVDWEELAHPQSPPEHSAVSPARVIDLQERRERSEELCAAGNAAYAAGTVAVLMVAGGMGSRLGFSGPKGCYEIGAHSGKSIYQIQAEKVLDCSRRSGHDIPFLVMTSPVTDEETRDFFIANGNFGLTMEQVRFFSQGTVPSLDQDGKALLAGPGELLTNPDGHGGCFTALVASGALARLREEGIEHIVYIQVDNILAPVDDPALIGLAECEQADVVTKVLEKAHPDEKVGHLVRCGDHDLIIEYTELSPEETRLRDANNTLVYRWGSPAMHSWRVSFLHRLAESGFRPPLHRSRKPLKAWAMGQGQQEVQGWKNERFIFDLIPQATTSVGLAIERSDEFAPVKNAEGDDSPASARRLASDAYARWFQQAGVSVEMKDSDLIEISPRYAGTCDRFLQRWDGSLERISGDYYLEDNDD
ncbi:MAG: UDPGP type 1 family protein [Planctomycetota bacterium]|nr:MAG: UDPGP type 1 family protein [Planctomycetota bacterium]